MFSKSVETALKKVQDAATFLAFLEVLAADWESANDAEKDSPSSSFAATHGWENTTISTFLKAAIAGARDNGIGGGVGTNTEASAWRQAADILYFGKMYE
jgi:hypothetical protein